MKVACLSGGVGGAKLAAGLHDVLEPGELTVIGNVGDDVEVLGMHVSPDLDSVLYALAGLNDEERGWGRAGETWRTLESAKEWGARAGSCSATSTSGSTSCGRRRSGAASRSRRSRAARRGRRARAAAPPGDGRPGPHPRDDARRDVLVPGVVRRPPARGRGGRRVVRRRRRARPRRPGVLEAIRDADAIVLAPSNPYVSLGPILAVAAIREAVEARGARCVAVSPLIGGRAVKGPLDRMLTRMAGGTTPAHVAGCYQGLIDALVIDGADAPAEARAARRRGDADDRPRCRAAARASGSRAAA